MAQLYAVLKMKGLLFIIYYLLFIIYYLLFMIHYLLFIIFVLCLGLRVRVRVEGARGAAASGSFEGPPFRPM